MIQESQEPNARNRIADVRIKELYKYIIYILDYNKLFKYRLFTNFYDKIFRYVRVYS